MFSKLKELVDVTKQVVGNVAYEPVVKDAYDLEDAPTDYVDLEGFGDNSTLTDQPAPVRPPDIGENE